MAMGRGANGREKRGAKESIRMFLISKEKNVVREESAKVCIKMLAKIL